MEKSVEQDDLVEMGDGTTGFIRRSSARFTVIETFDGKEVMVPNEDFITNRVVNWTTVTLKDGSKYRSVSRMDQIFRKHMTSF